MICEGKDCLKCSLDSCVLDRPDGKLVTSPKYHRVGKGDIFRSDILALWDKGYQVKDIATELKLCKNTVSKQILTHNNLTTLHRR